MACKRVIIPFVENDQEALRFKWENQDLSLFSVIRLRVRRPDGTLLEIDASIIDPGPLPAGVFEFQFSDGDLMTGSSSAEVYTVDLATGREDKLPNDDSMILQVRRSV